MDRNLNDRKHILDIFRLQIYSPSLRDIGEIGVHLRGEGCACGLAVREGWKKRMLPATFCPTLLMLLK